MIIYYVYNMLKISHDNKSIIKGIQIKFKLKDENIEDPDIYLGAQLSNMNNSWGEELWSISYNDYCSAMVNNVEETLRRKVLGSPSKYITPLSHVYFPEIYRSG